MTKLLRRIVRRVKWQIYLMKVSNLSGNVIEKYSNNLIRLNNGLKINVSNPLINRRTKASIFFGSYEADELKIIAKHLIPDLPTVELGASIGLTGVSIGKISTDRILCVEANPLLIHTLNQQLELNEIKNAVVLNCAVSTDSEEVTLKVGGSNDTSLLVKNQNGITVKAKSLSQILSENNVSAYNLVCDIEGSEADILLNDAGALTMCKLIVIELHPTTVNGKEYTIADMDEMIRGNGFTLVENSNQVFCYRKLSAGAV